MTDHFTDFELPDTELARQAHAFAYQIEKAAIANHSVRSYLFGRAMGRVQSLRPGADYDDELLFLACMLHDAGLSEPGEQGQRFEVDGADLAAGFLRDRGLAEERVRLVWEAIALHTSTGIAHRMRPEIALTHLGAGVDVMALGVQALPEGFTDRLHAALPRLEPDAGLADAIIDQVRRNPAKAPLPSLSLDLVRQAEPGFPVPDFRAAMRAAWPGVP